MKKSIYLILLMLSINVSYAGFPVVPELEIEETTVNSQEELSDNSTFSFVGKKFHLLSYFAGLFLGLLGVLIVYLTTKDKVKRKSAWYGAAVLAIIGLIVGGASNN